MCLWRVICFNVATLWAYIALAVFGTKILLAGDVEENPGPLSREEERELMKTIRYLPEVLEGQQTILAKIEMLKTGPDQINQTISSIRTKLEELKEEPPSTHL